MTSRDSFKVITEMRVCFLCSRVREKEKKVREREREKEKRERNSQSFALKLMKLMNSEPFWDKKDEWS